MVDLVDRMVHAVTAPYARGESDVFKYWNQIIYGWRRVKRLRTAPNISFSRSDINIIVDDWGYDVINYGMIVIDLFWDERDVSPPNVAMIQSMMPTGYGAVYPSSHVPPPKPQEKTYPEKMNAGLTR